MRDWYLENKKLVLVQENGDKLVLWADCLPLGTLVHPDGKKLFPAGIWDIGRGEIRAAMSAQRTDL